MLSATESGIESNDLIEIVRTDKNRKPVLEAQGEGGETNVSSLPPIAIGRTALEKEVLSQSTTKLREFGIELIDVRFMRINYRVPS